MSPLRVLDLFSGIGGFSLGLERSGMRVVQFVEIDPYCRDVLREHWPGVPIHDDIRTFEPPAGFADIICGGFPCQDISLAGKGAGLAGERSGLWSEFARLVRMVRPRYAIVENVSALLGRGLGAVLGDLPALGYDADWHCIPAASVGAPHRRDRLWILAYASGDQLRHNEQRETGRRLNLPNGGKAEPRNNGAPQPVADSDSGRREGERLAEHRVEQCAPRGEPHRCGEGRPGQGAALADAEFERLERFEQARSAAQSIDRSTQGSHPGWWAVEPNVGRVAHGVPARVDRLKALGNAVVPQIPEIIGEAIVKREKDRERMHIHAERA